MKQFLVVLLIVCGVRAHMIDDPFVGVVANATPSLIDSTLALMVSSSPNMPYNVNLGTFRKQDIDSNAPNNWRNWTTNRNLGFALFPVNHIKNTVSLGGVTLLGWYKLGNYSASQMKDTLIQGFNLMSITYDIKTPDNPNSSNVFGWLELNKSKTKIRLINWYNPLMSSHFKITSDTVESSVFPAIEDKNYHLIGFSHSIIGWNYEDRSAKHLITFYVDGKAYGTDTIPYPAYKKPAAVYNTSGILINRPTAGNCIPVGVVNKGTVNQQYINLISPDTFYFGGAAIYYKPFTAAQMKAVYDTNQTHNLRYQRSLSAVELAPAKPVISISCASLNPGLVHIPGNTMQIIAVNGSVLHTLETATGSIMLPRLTTGRYFLKTDKSVKSIYIYK